MNKTKTAKKPAKKERSKPLRYLWKTWRALLYAGPVALFFSYHPVISLGASESMNFEFSLAEIWLILFCLMSLINLKNFFKFYGKKLFLLLSFPVYAAISLLWTPNFSRALLTSGLLFLLVFAVLNFYQFLHTHPEKFRLLQKVLLFSAAGFAIFCWLQCFLDLFGVPRQVTLLCEGCTYTAFGFPHPNGLAIEPQFAGNLLLAPALLAVYLFLFELPRNSRSKKSSSPKLLSKINFELPLKSCPRKSPEPLFKHKTTYLFLAIFLPATLFLTFSRGAIYSFLLGLGVIFILRFSARAFWLFPLIASSLLIALFAQGLFAQVSPTTDTFWSGITKSIHQLTLGRLDLRPVETVPATISDDAQTSAQTSAAQPNTQSSTQPSTQPPAAQTSTFSGYVEDSTNIRVNLTNKALDIWDNSPDNLLLGTGLGSAGTVLYQKFPKELGTPKEIVQNQYASLLLELGLIGVLLAVVTLIFILRVLKPSPLFLGTLAAFLASLFFFSGLPNALHIYLFLTLLLNC